MVTWGCCDSMLETDETVAGSGHGPTSQWLDLSSDEGVFVLLHFLPVIGGH